MRNILIIISLFILCYSCKKEETANPNEKIEIASYASHNGDSLQLDSTAPAILNVSFISPSKGTYKVFVSYGDVVINTSTYVNDLESPSAFNDVVRLWKNSNEYGAYSWYIQKQGTDVKTETRNFILCQKKK